MNPKHLLEIGVGTGFTAAKAKYAVYCGVDISKETIHWLEESAAAENVSWVNADASDAAVDLGGVYDLIASCHTLEHVSSPEGFFRFIKKHLSLDGRALILFPNESKQEHHGVTWFSSLKELETLLDQIGFQVDVIVEIQPTRWNRAVRKIFWDIPKKMLRNSGEKVQTFGETTAFRINQRANLMSYVLAAYGNIIAWTTQLFPIYQHVPIDGSVITQKELLLELRAQKGRA